MSSIRTVCDSLGKTFPSLLVDNLGATGGLQLNSSPVKVKLIFFPLFLPKGNAILKITPKTVCDACSPAIQWSNLPLTPFSCWSQGILFCLWAPKRASPSSDGAPSKAYWQFCNTLLRMCKSWWGPPYYFRDCFLFGFC